MSIVSKTTKRYSGFSPLSIPGCQIWLDAADSRTLTLSGNNVTQWRDKSANGYAFTVTGTNPVLTTTFNGSYPSVRSTDTNTTLSASIPISNVLSATGYSIFVVGKITSGVVFMIMNDATNVWKIADIEYAGGSLVNVKCFSAGANLGYDPRNPFMMSLTYIRGSTFTAYFNGNAAYSASTATAGTLTGNSSFILFYGGTGYGSVSEASEVVVYNTLLSTSERQTVEGYLIAKWGLTSSLPATHPFRSVRPFTQAFQPIDIPGCTLWLDAADATTITFGSGSNVSEWNDKSGNANNATQGTDGNRPVYSSTNRNLSFTRTSSHFLNLPNSTLPSGNNSYGYFIVCTWAQAIDGLGIIGGGNYGTTGQVFALRSTGTNRQIVNYWWGNDFQTGNSAYTVNTPLIVECTYTSGGTRAILTNGTQLVSDTPAARNQGTGNNTIGRTWPGGNEFHDGTISEIIVYNAALTTSQRQQIEGYLAYKWGLRTSLPYTTLNVPFTPSQITGCQLWLDGADASTVTLSSGTNVSAWNDKSGNTRNATLLTSAGSVTYSSSRMNFAGAGALNSSVSIGTTTPLTIFVVTNNTSSVLAFRGVYGINAYGASRPNCLFLLRSGTNSNWWFSGGTGVTDGNTSTVSVAVNRDYIVANYWSASFTQINVDGTSYASSSAAPTSITNGATMTIGSITNGGTTLSEYWIGTISEIILYNTSLTPSQRQQVELYLANKWGLRVNLPTAHPFGLYLPLSVAFTPVQISGCSLWLDAADRTSMTLSGNNVTQWNDKSGNGLNVSSTGSPPSLLQNATNGINVLTYNGSQSLTRNSVTGSQLAGNTTSTFSSFIVFSVSNNTQNNMPFSWDDATYTWRILHQLDNRTTMFDFGNATVGGVRTQISSNVFTPTNNIYHVYSYTVSSANANLRISGGSFTATATLTGIGNFSSSSRTLNIGGYINDPGYRLKGNLAEIILFNQTLNTSQVQQIEGYLAYKWGLVSSLPSTHPYKKIRP